MRQRLLFLLVAGISGAAGGWWFTEAFLKEETPAPVHASASPSEMIGRPRPDFSLGSTAGEVFEAGDFDGQVWLVNFWATWCAPCREEMPMLSELHEQRSGQGFQVVGIALDDVQQARDFLDELGIRYPNMVGGVDVMATGADYGNSAGLLPYSVLIDRDGIIRWTSLGELEADELNARIEDLL